ncbi:MAG: type II toxin-antitoxin system RelE/ParE family toxin [Streptosporangiaceae bacterium]
MWRVRYLPGAEDELDALPGAEQAAVRNAEEKLKALGPDLGYPHSSAVQEAQGLRELRPRQGRSPWRALYRRYGEEFVIAAICPEADQDPRGFKRGCAAALERLADVKEG